MWRSWSSRCSVYLIWSWRQRRWQWKKRLKAENSLSRRFTLWWPWDAARQNHEHDRSGSADQRQYSLPSRSINWKKKGLSYASAMMQIAESSASVLPRRTGRFGTSWTILLQDRRRGDPQYGQRAETRSRPLYGAYGGLFFRKAESACWRDGGDRSWDAVRRRTVLISRSGGSVFQNWKKIQ